MPRRSAARVSLCLSASVPYRYNTVQYSTVRYPLYGTLQLRDGAARARARARHGTVPVAQNPAEPIIRILLRRLILISTSRFFAIFSLFFVWEEGRGVDVSAEMFFSLAMF